MEFWRWNESLSAAEIQELVVLGLLARTNQQSAGPNCSIFPVAQRVERRLSQIGAWMTPIRRCLCGGIAVDARQGASMEPRPLPQGRSMVN